MAESEEYRVPPFPALRAFHAAARHERLRDAAQELGITESAVSHQIRRLEDFVQVALFHRRAGGLVLSPQGERYFAGIDPAMGQLATATREVMGTPEQGRVSLTLPPSLAMLWLIPRLGAFEQACPEIRLNLVTTIRVVDLRRERIDLAIRYGRGAWPGVEAEVLMGETAMPVCRPDVLDEDAAQDPALALARCRLITSPLYPNEWEEWAKSRGLAPPDLTDALALDTHEQVLEAAAQGLGLAMGRSPMADAHLASGTLIAPFGRASRSETRFYLCRPTGSDPTAAAKRVARWLRQAAGTGSGAV